MRKKLEEIVDLLQELEKKLVLIDLNFADAIDDLRNIKNWLKEGEKKIRVRVEPYSLKTVNEMLKEMDKEDKLERALWGLERLIWLILPFVIILAILMV